MNSTKIGALTKKIIPHAKKYWYLYLILGLLSIVVLLYFIFIPICIFSGILNHITTLSDRDIYISTLLLISITPGLNMVMTIGFILHIFKLIDIEKKPVE